MSQKVKFNEKPYWVIFDKEDNYKTASALEMQGTVGKVIGSYYISDLHQQMFLVEYEDVAHKFDRRICCVISPGRHYSYIADEDGFVGNDKTKQ